MSEFSKAFKRLIRKLQPVDYFAAYECKVVMQYPDGTVDLEPFDERLKPGPTRVVLGAPAGYEKITVKAGSRCMVSFRNGQPNAPFVEFWSLDAEFTEIALRADTITATGTISLGAALSLTPVVISPFVTAVSAFVTAVGVYAAAVAAVLPVTAPATSALAAAITTFASAIKTYTATKVNAT
jgi:hypothetical protein